MLSVLRELVFSSCLDFAVSMVSVIEFLFCMLFCGVWLLFTHLYLTCFLVWCTFLFYIGVGLAVEF